MIEIKEKKNCCGCYACYNACPVNAIEMIEDEKGFKYPVVEKAKCINCGLCEKVCPIRNKSNIDNNQVAYACYNKDEAIRLKSSSGGIFTLIATYIIRQGGIVFGAAFDENFNVKHIKVDNVDDLEKLRGSKYVQSSIGETFKQAKETLNNGQKVLFTGTPCQIEGLKSYLQKDYENLYTQDIICHGVPSPKAWNKYKEYREKCDKEKPENITFRNKDNGWMQYNVDFKYKNKHYKQCAANDLYINTFLQNVILRESCYACNFKKKNRNSDITLADFWGIDNVLPNMYDNKGTSLVIVNSEKGKKLLENISAYIKCEEVNLDEAIKYNPSMIKSSTQNYNRDNFFNDLDKERFDIVAKKYITNEHILKKILRKIKNIIKKPL